MKPFFENRFIRLFLVVFSFLFVLAEKGTYAQTGSNCQNSHQISALPFLAEGLTTEFSGDYYGDNLPCNVNYMTGREYVFTYTPSVDQHISVALRNTGQGAGVFIMDACPNDLAVNCIGFAEEGFDGNPVIKNASLIAGKTYYIIVSTWDLLNNFPFTPFDIEVKEVHQIDVWAKWAWNPFSYRIGGEEYVSIIFVNNGVDTLKEVVTGFSVDNSPFYYDTVNVNLGNGEEYFHKFFGSIYDFTQVGPYELKVVAKVTGDGNETNDTMTRVIYNLATINSFPYVADFESDTNGWVKEYKSVKNMAISWERGIPSGTLINDSNGNYAMCTNADGNTIRSEESYILPPSFDFSSLQKPVVEMRLWYETDQFDIVKLEYCPDSLYYHWYTVGVPGEGQNWYNTPVGITDVGWTGSSGGYVVAKYTMDGMGGNSNIMLRLLFKGNANVSEGVALDYFKIYESPDNDMGIQELILPEDNCGPSNCEAVKVIIRNYGLVPQADFQVGYSINNQSYVYENYSDTIHPGDSVLYAFTQCADLSASGRYSIKAKSFLVGDQSVYNDSIELEYLSFDVISQIPFSENFELTEGGFYAIGENTTWEWGIPADSVLVNSFSGQKVWATNLSGYHNLAEKSYLYSPCFSWSELSSPVINFAIWYNTEISQNGLSTYMNLFQSKDRKNWTLTGPSAATDSNWYNSGYSWIGNSEDWKEVNTVITGFQTGDTIQFRFEMNGFLQKHGYAVDDFSICNSPQAIFDYSVDGLDVQFYNQSQNNTIVFWDLGDGTIESNEGSFIHSYSNGDTMLVSLVAENQCTSDTLSMLIKPNAIPEYLTSDRTLFWPNPFSDFLIVDNSEGSYIEVYDCSWRLVQKEEVINGKISLNDLEDGLYFFVVKEGNNVSAQKLLKISR